MGTPARLKGEEATPIQEEKFRVAVTGPGLDFSREVSAKVANDIVSLALTGDVKSDQSKTRTGRDSTLALAEVLQETGASKNPEIIGVIGYYLTEYKNKPNFTREDISEGFEDAGEKTPGNLPRDIKAAVSKGYIAPKGKDAFYVTRSGRELVERPKPKD